jgi:hypothetical protein
MNVLNIGNEKYNLRYFQKVRVEFLRTTTAFPQAIFVPQTIVGCIRVIGR